jgi:hypothetical protein
MGATLKRRRECFRWKRDAWDTVLHLAREFGWRPAGTARPRGLRKAQWDCNDYINCERQQVEAEDALSLAAALDRALQAIPIKVNAKPPKKVSAQLAFFFGYAREGLADFVGFCRLGAFRITDDVCDR